MAKDIRTAASSFIDRFIPGDGLSRKLLPEDHPDAVYDPIREDFVESDEALRKRIYAALVSIDS